VIGQLTIALYKAFPCSTSIAATGCFSGLWFNKDFSEICHDYLPSSALLQHLASALSRLNSHGTVAMRQPNNHVNVCRRAPVCRLGWHADLRGYAAAVVACTLGYEALGLFLSSFSSFVRSSGF
jgi:hypothetical protein